MPLPTYQPSGIFAQPTPKLDFANLREDERSSQLIGQSLDRLSEFAFKAAAKQAIAEGEQWAYNNPISEAQIQEAKQGPLTVASRVPAAGTFFGDAARKVQAGQLRSTLELTARGEIAKIYEQVEAGAITDLSQLEKEFYAIQKGNAKVLASIDPEQANAFQASIATAANPVYIAGAKKIGEMRAKIIEDIVNRSLNDFDSLVRPIFDNETDPERIKDQISIYRDRVLAQIVQTNNPVTFSNTQKALDSKIEKAYIDRVSNYLASDDFAMATPDTSFSSRLAAIDSGNLGKYQALWAKMPTELQDKIKTQFLKREADKEKALQVDEKAKEKQNKDDSIEALNNYYKGDISQEELVNTLISTKQATPTLLKSIYSKEEKPTDGNTLFWVSNQIDKGLFGKEDIEKLFNEGKINLKESLDFRKQIKTESKDFADAKMILKGKLKLPSDGLILGDQYKKQQEKYSSMLADLINASNEAIAAGKPFNPISYANKMAVEGNSQLSQANIDAKDSLLANKWRSLGYTPPQAGTFYTEAELKRSKDKDGYPIPQKEINRILTLQNDAKKARE